MRCHFGLLLAVLLIQDSACFMWNTFDIEYWRCVIKRGNFCPDPDIRIFFYSGKDGLRRKVDLRRPNSWTYDWEPEKPNVIIIHGFNGTERLVPMTYIRDAYIRRGDFNVFTVDWEGLAKFPCYLSALSNSRLVAQCSAQFYSHLTRMGATAENTLCVGHSLGAHICGMMSNHLTKKLHKIIGLDPARPLVDRFSSKAFRLTRDDAHLVQLIHTNAGFLAETARQEGHVEFCINGGKWQPACRNQPRRLRRARCAHFMAGCFFAATVGEAGRRHTARRCAIGCQRNQPEYSVFLERVPMGHHTQDSTRGTYCIDMPSTCSYN